VKNRRDYYNNLVRQGRNKIDELNNRLALIQHPSLTEMLLVPKSTKEKHVPRCR